MIGPAHLILFRPKTKLLCTRGGGHLSNKSMLSHYQRINLQKAALVYERNKNIGKLEWLQGNIRILFIFKTTNKSL